MSCSDSEDTLKGVWVYAKENKENISAFEIHKLQEERIGYEGYTTTNY